jgi:acyl-CoA synthetase (NDP forming)
MHELEPLFRPQSVAVIGASADPTKLGGRVLHNLITLGYGGRIHPVHARDAEVQGLPAFRSVANIPGELDQAIIITPAPAVEGALQACAAKGVRVAQILSSGFGEVGGEGAAMQARLVALAREAGMRITGPNALGSISPPDSFFATFSSLMATARPAPGRIGVATQSGAFGSHVYAAATLRGLGISRAIATGNEADVDVAACIDYLAEDPGTSVICAALEGCRDGAALRRALLKAAAAGKPVVVMKVGSTEVGAAAAATHTGSLAGEDRIFDTVFRECGAWRAHAIEEMVDAAYVCSVGRMPPSAAVGIVTISGGIGVLMADACVERDLSVPSLAPDALERIATVLPVAGGRNPVDVTAGVGGRLPVFEPVIEAVLDGAGAGTVLVYLSHIGRNPARFGPMTEVLSRLRVAYPDRLLICVMTSSAEIRLELEAMGVPVFEDPTRAVAAVAAAAALRARHALAEPLPVLPPAAPLSIAGGGEAEAKAVIARAGIQVLPERVCTTAEAAAEAAAALGFPVAMKILSADIPHKTDIGGVALGLADGSAVRTAFTAMMERVRREKPAARIDGVLIAPMLQGGLEVIVGVQRDPVFGPMVMFGLGGVGVELFRDVAFASAPLNRARAERLIGMARGAKLLDGWRGSPALDREALLQALCDASMLGAQQDSLDALEINPLLVMEHGAVALDALLTPRAG